jgi:hypothetical protein
LRHEAQKKLKGDEEAAPRKKKAVRWGRVCASGGCCRRLWISSCMHCSNCVVRVALGAAAMRCAA